MGTSRLESNGASRKHPGDFPRYFLIPWAGGTLAFFILIWWRNSLGFVYNWQVGIVASGILALWCFWRYFRLVGRSRDPVRRVLP
jgi:hypothetical protein